MTSIGITCKISDIFDPKIAENRLAYPQTIQAIPGAGAKIVTQSMNPDVVQKRLEKYMAQLLKTHRLFTEKEIGLPTSGIAGDVYVSTSGERFYCKGSGRQGIRIFGADHIKNCAYKLRCNRIKVPLKILVVPDKGAEITFKVSRSISLDGATIYAKEVKQEGKWKEQERMQLEKVIKESCFADSYPSNFIRNEEGIFIIDTEAFSNEESKPLPPTPEELAEQQKQTTRLNRRKEIANIPNLHAQFYQTLQQDLTEQLEDGQWNEARDTLAKILSNFSGFTGSLSTKLDYLLEAGVKGNNKAILNQARLFTILLAQNQIRLQTPLARVALYLIYVFYGNEKAARNAIRNNMDMEELIDHYQQSRNQKMLRLVILGKQYADFQPNLAKIEGLIAEGKFDEAESIMKHLELSSSHVTIFDKFKPFDALRARIEAKSYRKECTEHERALLNIDFYTQTK